MIIAHFWNLGSNNKVLKNSEAEFAEILDHHVKHGNITEDGIEEAWKGYRESTASKLLPILA